MGSGERNFRLQILDWVGRGLVPRHEIKDLRFKIGSRISDFRLQILDWVGRGLVPRQ